MNANQFRQAAYAAIEEIINHHESVANGTKQVLPSIKPGYLKPGLPQEAPSEPQSWKNHIQPDIAKYIIPGLTNWQSPHFMAFCPATTNYPSILGEMYSSAFTAPAFNWLCSPASTELETIVLDWFCDALHLPRVFRSDSTTTDRDGSRISGGSVIQGSASEAIVTCMVAARERYTRRRCERLRLEKGSKEWEDQAARIKSRLVALGSDQAHSSTAKGARIVGTRFKMVPTFWESGLICNAQSLEEMIRKCFDEGLEPYYITLNYGTTNTGAQDPLHELKNVLAKYPEIWIHVDAAYAGTALICPEYANVGIDVNDEIEVSQKDTYKCVDDMKQIDTVEDWQSRLGSETKHDGESPRLVKSVPLPAPSGRLPRGPTQWLCADSFDTNLAKWLLVSFDASILYVQNRHDLTTALNVQPAYLQNEHTDSGRVIDYRDWQIPLGRRFRALKIWFVVRTYGIEGLRAHIRRTVRVGEYFTGLVRDTEAGRQWFEVVAQPVFGLTCFRIRPTVILDQLLLTAHVRSLEQKYLDALTAKSEDLANQLSKQVVETINNTHTLFLTASSTHGKSFIRVINGNENSNEEAMKSAFERILDTTRVLVESAVKLSTNA